MQYTNTLGSALGLWPGTEGARYTLINHSENHSFRIDTADGPAFVLRVHRAGYQSRTAIGSELEWLDAIRRDTKVKVPQALSGKNGERVQLIPFAPDDARLAVLFAFEMGEEPSEKQDLTTLFESLGETSARLHDHARRWTSGVKIERQKWTASNMLDANGLWGDWRLAPGVIGPVADLLHVAGEQVRQELAEYGQGSDRFGLIHADMRLANVLVDRDQLTVIDFDDCGFGWHLYDCAAALSFIDTEPRATHLQQAWIDGYRRVLDLGPEHVAMLPAMMLLRRMVLLAWIGSHSETPLAQAHAPRFAADTAELAAAYLEGRGAGAAERRSIAAVTPQIRPTTRK